MRPARAGNNGRTKDGQQTPGDYPREGGLQHSATKSARPSASETKDAHQPPSGGTRSAQAGKERGPRMVSRRPLTTHGKVTERC
eukprot:356106-Chlamydomonas_euryale.AAC.6